MSRFVGLALMAVGIGGYVLTDMTSPTALIPAAFGLVISMLGYYGRQEATRRTAMHLSMGIALAGLLGSIRGLWSLPALLSGAETARPAAVISQSAMAVILLVYLAMGFKSFRAARIRK